MYCQSSLSEFNFNLCCSCLLSVSPINFLKDEKSFAIPCNTSCLTAPVPCCVRLRVYWAPLLSFELLLILLLPNKSTGPFAELNNCIPGCAFLFCAYRFPLYPAITTHIIKKIFLYILYHILIFKN